MRKYTYEQPREMKLIRAPVVTQEVIELESRMIDVPRRGTQLLRFAGKATTSDFQIENCVYEIGVKLDTVELGNYTFKGLIPVLQEFYDNGCGSVTTCKCDYFEVRK